MSKRILFSFPNGIIFHTSACLIQGLIELGHLVNIFEPQENLKIDSRGISTPSIPGGLNFQPPIDSNYDSLLLDVTHGYGESIELINKFLILGLPVSIINMSDSANFHDYDPRFTVFSAHTSSFARRKGSIVPMGFGLSNDIIKRSQEVDSLTAKRSNVVISNFKPSLSQSVRNFLSFTLERKLSLEGVLSYGFTEAVEYVRRLIDAKLILCYGGDFYRDLSSAEAFSNNPSYHFDDLQQDVVILRWDSWRFYEACVFGCIPVHLDFKRYGMSLPVLPNDKFCLQIRLDNIEVEAKRIIQLIYSDEECANLSREARKWVIDNYSPKAMARYFIENIWS
jgi:hypothetical protein